MIQKETPHSFLRIGTEAVKRAAEEIQIFNTKSLKVSPKNDGSLATNADQRAENKIIEIINLAYPHHKLLGEELGLKNEGSDSSYLWVFDPIDGTWAYIKKENTYCVNLALIKNDEPIMGIVYNPSTDEMFRAFKGSKATLNNQELPLNEWNDLARGTLNYKLSKRFRGNIDILLNIWQDGYIGKLINQGGSPAYCLAMVAKGAHAVFVMGCGKYEQHPWDFSAGVLLVQSSGGKVTDLAGNDIDPLKPIDYIIASSNIKLHHQIMNLIDQYKF